jgi:hypothetical protein
MEPRQGDQAVGGPPSSHEIAELVAIWAMLSEERRKAVTAFARVVARE